MSRPTLGDYSLAIQSPERFLADRALQSCKVEVDHFGNPRPRTGGFAVTYQLSGPGKSWAVRCFHKDVGDLATRYTAIDKALGKANSSLFVDFQYMSDGILVNGTRWPILKMEWVEGHTLQSFLEIHHDDSRKLRDFLQAFRDAVRELERMGVAHGDLQHGNILVRNDRPVLVDYDGMFVPSMGVVSPRELGHANYQSPLRDKATFNADLDRFSAIVIGLGLEALIHAPGLWKKYSNGDNILFVSSDFTDPLNSPLLKDLAAIPTLKAQAEQFQILCATPLGHLPKLESFLAGRELVTRSATVQHVPPARRQWDVIEGTDRARLLSKEGDQVEVFGKILAVAQLPTSRQQICWAINFGDYLLNEFSVMVWQETIEKFVRLGTTRESLVNRYVKITGLIQLYNSIRGTVPQIILWDPSELHFISEHEMEQLRRDSNRGGTSSNTWPAHKTLQPVRSSPTASAVRPVQPSYSSTDVGTKTSATRGPNVWPSSKSLPSDSRSDVSVMSPTTPAATTTHATSAKDDPTVRPPQPDVAPDASVDDKRPWWKFWR